MFLKSILNRLARIAKFVRSASTITAVPKLVVVAIARDSPFSNGRALSSIAGKCFGIMSVPTRATDGQPAFIDTRDLGQLISCEEVLIEQTYDLSSVPFVPDVIVDCGAHVGLFTLIAGLRYSSAKLIAFEPDEDNFRTAQLQLARFAPRLHLVKAAVSTEDGEGWFCRDHSNTGHLTSSHDGQNQRVQLVDLLCEVRKLAGKRLLLKMDIEGEERKVLPHIIAHLPNQCAIFLEIHGGQEAWDEISQSLLDVGFQNRISRERMPFVDAFAIRN
jgi:FkbM family methyltransferase